MPVVQAALRCDVLQMTRQMAQSYVLEEMNGRLVKDATDPTIRTVDAVRAGRLLMEIAGMGGRGR